MSNKEIAQEQLNKDKEERRMELIMFQLERINLLKSKIAEAEEKINELETKEIILDSYKYSE